MATDTNTDFCCGTCNFIEECKQEQLEFEKTDEFTYHHFDSCPHPCEECPLNPCGPFFSLPQDIEECEEFIRDYNPDYELLIHYNPNKKSWVASVTHYHPSENFTDSGSGDTPLKAAQYACNDLWDIRGPSDI